MKYQHYLTKLNYLFCKQLENNIYLFICLFIYITYILTQNHIAYGTNDNIAILFNAKNGFISAFNSYFYMKYLNILYSITTQIPWYGASLYIINILGLFVFIKSLIKINEFKFLLIPFIFIYLYLYSLFLIQIDYNSTSIMIGMHSLFAFLVIINNKNISYRNVFILGVLFSFAFLVRTYGSYAVIVYSFPILLIFFILNYKRKLYFLVFFLPFLILLIGDNIGRTYFISSQQNEYNEFNKVRGALHGYPALDKIAETKNMKIINEIGWTTNDFALFKEWIFFGDEEKFNVKSLNYLLDNSLLERRGNKLKIYTELYFQQLYILVERYKWYIGFLLLLLMTAIIGFNLFAIGLSSVYLVYIISLIIYMDIFYRFPVRIGYPILLMCASFFLLIIFSFPYKKINVLKSAYTVLFIIAISLFYFNVKILHINKNNSLKLESTLQKLNTSYINKIFYIPPQSMNLELMHPLKTYNINFIIIPGGTATFSPLFYSKLKEANIKNGASIIPSMINSPDKFIITSNNHIIKGILYYLIQNHDIKNVKAKKVEILPNNQAIFKLVTYSK